MQPKPRFLHSGSILSAVKLAEFRQFTTEHLKFTLRSGQPSSLKTRPDGTVLDGHHRLTILLERAEEIDNLPREMIEKRDHER